ncbi:MAG: GNAT family N-acetyltransferase [Pseudomonadota bacterium]
MVQPFPNATFASDRLAMRPQATTDAEALFEAYSDVDLMTWWSSAPHSSVDQTRDYLAARTMPSDWRGWTMIDRASGAVVGTLGAHESKPQVVEIGYLVLRRFWGQGLAHEGVSRLIELLFETEGHRRIWADTDPDNAGSNALLQRLGFTREGHLRAEWETHIGVRDSYIWGLLRDEWRR